MVYYQWHLISEDKVAQIISTKAHEAASHSLAGPFSDLYQGEVQVFEPVERVARTTRSHRSEFGLNNTQGLRRIFEPPVTKSFFAGDVNANSIPIQIWEGTVVEVDADNGVMQVLLDAKMGNIPRHAGEIDLEWVSDQDRDLVVPGAVFYLTLFKRSTPSVENAQELRFRRRPSWSVSQLKQVAEDAATLLSKMKSLSAAT